MTLLRCTDSAVLSPQIDNDDACQHCCPVQALQCRMEACLAAGRAVILVGDLNICPQPIDSCDPGDLGKFRDRADKKWLSAVMKQNGGYFVDLFRHFYPTR